MQGCVIRCWEKIAPLLVRNAAAQECAWIARVLKRWKSNPGFFCVEGFAALRGDCCNPLRTIFLRDALICLRADRDSGSPSRVFLPQKCPSPLTVARLGGNDQLANPFREAQKRLAHQMESFNGCHLFLFARWSFEKRPELFALRVVLTDKRIAECCLRSGLACLFHGCLFRSLHRILGENKACPVKRNRRRCVGQRAGRWRAARLQERTGVFKREKNGTQQPILGVGFTRMRIVCGTVVLPYKPTVPGLYGENACDA
jgi:hypothetical protein